MVRHRFDPLALVLGLVFAAAGIIVLSGGELIDEGRPLVPAGLIALGAALLVQVVRRARPADDAEDPAIVLPSTPWADDTQATRSAGTDDVDRLFAPVDEELARWDADRAAADATEKTATETSDPADTDPTETIDATKPYDRPEG